MRQYGEGSPTSRTLTSRRICEVCHDPVPVELRDGRCHWCRHNPSKFWKVVTFK